ncbi:MAG TPA: hypothetical protein DEP42_04755 [Ruminococcaceae bacterium]|nr:hypothetical protein [Oscillospiraceae bacterium]
MGSSFFLFKFPQKKHLLLTMGKGRFSFPKNHIFYHNQIKDFRIIYKVSFIGILKIGKEFYLKITCIFLFITFGTLFFNKNANDTLALSLCKPCSS